MVAAIITWDQALPDLTDGATHYHAHWVSPEWRREMRSTRADDAHRFYRRKNEAPPTAPRSSDLSPTPAALREEMTARSDGFWTLGDPFALVLEVELPAIIAPALGPPGD